MPLNALLLWTSLYPAVLVFGLAGGIVAYWLAHPRPPNHCGEVPTEGWRAYAFLVAVLGILLGLELGLWGFVFGYRAPLPFTGFPDRLGWLLVALAPTPLVVAFCRADPTRGRPARTAAVLVTVGLAVLGLGRIGRAQAWSALTAAAPVDDAARDEVITLTAYRYVPVDQSREVLDFALPDAESVIGLVTTVQSDREPPLDSEMRAYLADRLAAALESGDPPAADTALASVPAVWWLTGNGDRTIRAYALTPPELRQAALAGADLDFQAVATHALDNAPRDVVIAVLGAIRRPAALEPLGPELIAALSRHLGAPEPVDELVLVMLLEDGSRAALRPILPRFTDPEAPEWMLMRQHCPRRTQGLVLLQDAERSEIAEGARAVLAYVRQYCVSSRPIR